MGGCGLGLADLGTGEENKEGEERNTHTLLFFCIHLSVAAIEPFHMQC